MINWKELFKFVNVTKTDSSSTVEKEEHKSNTDILINGCILAGLGFFSTYAGLLASGITDNPAAAAVASGVSAGLQFFTSLAAQRGLKK